jgi:hypothetical protein
MRILIRLPKDRRRVGRLTLEGAAAGFSCPCLGRADQIRAEAAMNPTRDPLRKFGDTPAGTYAGAIGPTWADKERSYGPHPVIRLEPTGGPAAQAKANGRDGLLIHGGAPAMDGQSLRPTNGCVRVSNSDQAAIVAALRAAGAHSFPVEIVEE